MYGNDQYFFLPTKTFLCKKSHYVSETFVEAQTQRPFKAIRTLLLIYHF